MESVSIGDRPLVEGWTGDTSTVNQEGSCPHCSGHGTTVWHSGSPCPKVRAIEYHRNGAIKRIEYK